MAKIIDKKTIAENVVQMEVEAPGISKKALPGQFVILMAGPKGERIPLTVVGTDPEAGTVTIVFQVVGKTTGDLSRIEKGGSIKDIVGPLGCPTEIEKEGTTVIIGGGVGIAEVLPVSRAFRKAGSEVIGIIGARSRNILIFEKEMSEACNKLYVTTDDGSYSRKGLVTEVLRELMQEASEGRANPIKLVYAVGPVPMMRAVSETTKPAGIKTLVSLNAVMVDGTGMCGSCRVTVGGKTKCACVDGPEFNGHDVEWRELGNRLRLFREQEEIAKKGM